MTAGFQHFRDFRGAEEVVEDHVAIALELKKVGKVMEVRGSVGKVWIFNGKV
jgi:hypothetical protein